MHLTHYLIWVGMGGMFSDKLLEIDLSPLVPNEVWLDQTPRATSMRLFGSTTRVTRVSLTDMRNINNPALQAERLVKSNLFYQGHTGLRSRTVRCQ